MNVLVIGGTQFMGVHLVRKLINEGHDVTIATRGKTPDEFGDAVTRLTLDRTDGESIKRVLNGLAFDVIYDTQAYCSNEIKTLLDVVTPHRYIQISTLSVYFEDLKPHLKEESYDPHTSELIWCNRSDFHYGIIKQQAENAIFQAYPHIDAVVVRFPYVIGTDDYTKRLLFYVEHIVNEQKMHIDNIDTEFAFVNSQEAGEFLAWLGGQNFTGPINAASYGVATLKEIITYIENKTGKKTIITEDGAKAPYNGTPSYSLDLSKSKENGFTFSELTAWLYPLLDELIEEVGAKDEKMLKNKIVPLKQKDWQDYELPFHYISEYYYDVKIDHTENGIHVAFVKEKYPIPYEKMPDEHDKLFQPWWPEIKSWGIIDDGKLIAAIETSVEAWSNRLRVTEFWVDEKYRRQGIAGALMDKAIQRAKDEKRRAVILETQSSNSGAIAFYFNYGFSLIGFDSCAYQNNDIARHEVRMEMGFFLESEGCQTIEV